MNRRSLPNRAGGAPMMIELIQGEGGVLPLDKEYVQQAAEFCRAKDILFLIDEVQTGIGRTGSRQDGPFFFSER